MKTHAHIPLRARRVAGVGLVTAIFLLVVLAGLGVAAVTLYTSQQASSTLDEQGARAYQAARAGIEWGLFQKMRNGAFCPTASNQTIASTPIAMPAGTSLSAFTVTVTCERRYGSDGTDPLARYVITAYACNLPAGGNCPNTTTNSPDYVARRIEVEI